MCKLNEKFKEWKKWYSEDDNSICAQIRDMLLDAAVFNVINEARKYATTDARGYPELNELIHGLINRSFLKTQTLSIRKLYDERQEKKREGGIECGAHQGGDRGDDARIAAAPRALPV